MFALVSMFSCFLMKSSTASSRRENLETSFSVLLFFFRREASFVSLIAPRVRFKVFGFSNLLVMYFVRILRPLSFLCVNLSMYEINLNINDRLPPTTG